MKMRKGILFLFAILPAACSRPATVPDPEIIESYVQVAERLSNQRVNAFAEDADGHIWIGTARGLNKYNIHNFYQCFSGGDSLGLPDNRITALRCSASGQLWVGTPLGVSVHMDDGRFRQIRILDDNKNVSEILETRDGQILFNNNGLLLRYDAEADCIRPVVREYGFRSVIGQDGRIWSIAGLTELRCYDPSDFHLIDSWRPPHLAYHLTMATTGEIWLSGMGALSIFDPRSETWLDIPEAIRQEQRLMQGDIDILFAIGPDMLLHSITDGLFCFNQSTGRLLHQSDPGFPYDAPDFEYHQLFHDSKGNLWFGSTDQGYSVSYAAKEGFGNNRYLTDFFNHKSVTALSTDREGRLWISTLNDGLYVYDTESKELRPIDLNRFVPDNNLGYVRCSSITCDAQGELWLVLMEKYRVLRCRYDGRDLKVIDRIDQFNPTSVSQDDLGRIWISNYTGELLRYDKGTRHIDRVQLPNGQRTIIPTLLQVTPGRMLAAPYGNPICEVFTNTAEIQFVSTPDAEWEHAPRSYFSNPTCLFQDSAGDIWLGTTGGGLLRYSDEKRHTSPVSGTPCPDICSIQEDLQGNLWVSTMNGLARYDRTVGAFSNYFDSDGTGGNLFCERSSCLLPDGTLVFGGTHGLTMFNPLDLQQKRNVKLVFEDLKVHNRLVVPSPDGPIDRELVHQPKVTIRDDQNGFSISYAALDYSEFKRHRYTYMMEGFDHYWIEAGTANEANYANLPPGRYRFRVMVQEDPSSEQALDIHVLPPWFKTWWAHILFILLALGLVLLITLFYRRIHRVRKQAAHHIREVRREQERAEQEREAEKRLNSTQMNYFANIAHEFRTPLTMIAGPVGQLVHSDCIRGEDRKLLEIVQRSSTWMLSLVGQLLDFNRIGNNKLRIKVAKDDIVEPLRSTAALFRFNAESKHIEFNTYGLEDPFVMWRDADKVTKIVMNLLSNALKFTPPGGTVSLSFDVIPRSEAAARFPLTEADTDPQYAMISVTDTGCGIPEDQLEKIFERFHQTGRGEAAGSGIGLFYSRALAELHHGYITAANRESGGAEFSFILPVSAASYAEDERSTGDPVKPMIPLPGTAVPEEPQEDPDKRRVVVVDDDIDVANYVKILLSPYYKVIVHFDADSTLKALEEEAPDLVISDVVMPGRSGYELCEAIKEDLQLSHIPVILVTAKVAVESQVQGLDKGADAYVTKPFDPSYLLALVKSLLDNRDKLRRRLGTVTRAEDIKSDELSPRDSAFMKELYALMDKELANQELDITRMTEMMRISRTKFYYKVKGLTGENPGVFFKRYKLNRAADLLKEGKYNMSEIAYMTGFNTLSHFSTSFKKQFGMPPSEYVG
ncbi:MAG: response regulator [Bacteroidales bacterium]|nr:response regulator [Bacteroidales bacterium]